MILSMTGFGRGVATSETKKITVDIKSLNSKQFDLMMRVPSIFKELELEIRGTLAAKLERGKIDFSANCESIGGDVPVKLNGTIIAAYKKQIENLSSELGIATPSDWYSTLLRLPDALSTDSIDVNDKDIEIFKEAVKHAVNALIEFRISEGHNLFIFFTEKIRNLSELLEEIGPYEAERIPKIRERIEEQLSRLNSVEYDKGRLEQELIFYIEKLDITEEKTRLRAHLSYFLETMGEENGPYNPKGVGKKLGFIAQEMGREINTLGSKSNHSEMQKIVVRMKDVLEQIKEQVLNVL